MGKRSPVSVSPLIPSKKGCPYCDADLRIAQRSDSFRGVHFGEFEVYACPGCKRFFFGRKANLEIERIAKQKGLWGKGSLGRARRMAGAQASAKHAVHGKERVSPPKPSRRKAGRGTHNPL